jgi:hypothetical protein
LSPVFSSAAAVAFPHRQAAAAGYLSSHSLKVSVKTRFRIKLVQHKLAPQTTHVEKRGEYGDIYLEI